MIIHVRRRTKGTIQKLKEIPSYLNFTFFIKIFSKFPLWEIAVEVTKMTMKNIPQKLSKEFQIHPTRVSKRKFQAKQFLDLFHKILRKYFFMKYFHKNQRFENIIFITRKLLRNCALV